MRKYLPSGLIISVRTFVLLIFAAGAVILASKLASLAIEDQAVYSYCVINVVYVFCGTFFLVGSLVTSLWCDLRWDD
jgi:hypothetical protein